MIRFLKSLVYAPKYEKEADVKFNKEISIAIFGIVLCMICLTMSTWAYFTANVETPNQTIQAGHYTAQVVVEDANGQAVSPETDGSYKLATGTYTVTITGEGTASNGYVRITNTAGGSPHTTSVVKPNGTPQTFTLVVQNGQVNVTFTGIFGSPAEPDWYPVGDEEHSQQTVLTLQG